MTDPNIPQDVRSPEAVAEEGPERHRGSGVLTQVKTFLSALLLIAISGGIGYGIGFFQTRSQIEQVTARKDAALAELQAQLTAAQTQATAAEARSELAQVRLLLLESIGELDQNNYGNANAKLRAAEQTLNPITISRDSAQLAQLKADISATEVNLVVNPVELRKTLRDYSEQINGLLPE